MEISNQTSTPSFTALFNSLNKNTILSNTQPVLDLAQSAIKLAADYFLQGRSAESAFKNCITPVCLDLNQNEVELKEKKAMHVIASNNIVNKLKHLFVAPEFQSAQEFLRFRKDDPRPKFLYMSAAADHSPWPLSPENRAEILVTLAKEYDIKYKEFCDFYEVCEEIKEGIKTGRLDFIVINAHGNPDVIQIGKTAAEGKYIWKNDNFGICFSPLPPTAKIILFSCSVGAKKKSDPNDNIANKIAINAHRPVIAPTDLSYPTLQSIVSLKPLMFFQPATTDPTKNVFKVFYPSYTKCPHVIQNDLNPRELTAINAIKNNLISKFLLDKQASFKETKEFLRLCKDDPKDKFLFLSSEYDPLNIFNPDHFSEILVQIADRYDLAFKVINQFDAICEATNNASKLGVIKNIAIQVIGLQNKLIFSKTSEGESSIGELDFRTCFNGLAKDGRIILFSNSDDSSQTYFMELARRLALDSNRFVIASTQPIDLKKISILSTEPFMIHQPNSVDSSKNAFQIFTQFRCQNVSDLDKSNISAKELKALEAIKTDLIGKSMLSNSATFYDLQEYLRTCPSDPRDKFLYLSSSYKSSKNPCPSSALLGSIANQYDLTFKEIKIFNDICNTVDEASQSGRLSAVLIDAYYDPSSRASQPKDQLRLSFSSRDLIDESEYDINWHLSLNMFPFAPAPIFFPFEISTQKKAPLTPDQYKLPSSQVFSLDKNVTKCFEGLDPSGKIILFVNSLPEVNRQKFNTDFPSDLSFYSNRSVIFGKNPIDCDQLKVVSESPFEIFQADPNNQNENMFNEFYSPN